MLRSTAHTSLSFVISFVVLAAWAAAASPLLGQGSRGYDPELFSALEWRSIGPYRGGRVTAVAGVVGQPFVHYMGATGGGVWKTVDGGMTWEPVSDDYFTAGSIGAIAVAASDPNVVYVGTGESPIRGNTSPGDGLYRSVDAGKTWTHIGLEDAGQVGRIEVHPSDADLVYVAVLGHAFGPNETRGVFRSKDGGATWEKILYRDENTGAIDIALDPSNPRVIYAGLWQVRRMPWGMESGGPGGGIFKSADGGDSWTEITHNKGLPQGVLGKIGITVSRANPERVWAIVEAEDGGVFRSDDGGEAWKRVNEDRSLRQRAWYYSHIYADPQNEEAVYVLNVRFHKSVDGGKTYNRIDTPHGDNHDLWIDPENPLHMLEGNDGGANVTYNGGKSWTTLYNQPTAQFYHVTTTNHFPYHVCGAQQDNSTLCVASRTAGRGISIQDWYSVGGGESGYIAPRPDDPNIVYAGSYDGHLTRFDRSTGQIRNIHIWPDNPMGWGAGELRYRFQWTFPIEISPHDPNVLYVAANVVFRSTDEGQTWETISPDLTRNDKSKQVASGGPITKDNTSVEYYGTIFALEPSPLEENVIWAGSDDGLVHITRDGGANWENVTPGDMPDWGLVSIIEASHSDPGTVYLAINRYKLDDFSPYIFRTTNYGKSWKRITKGIPETHYVRVVREDPKRKGLLYAGTEFGIYVSFDDGENWQTLQLNLPVVPIRDLAVKDDDLVAGTHGRSFWILDDLTPLHQLSDEVARADLHLFKPRDIYRLTSSGSRAAGALGENPPRGVMVHYYFKQAPEEEVKIGFLEPDGTLIHEFSSLPEKDGDRGGDDGGGASDDEDEGDVPAAAGMNRFVWNLRYEEAARFPGMILWSGNLDGPRAVPGPYQVRLSVGDRTLTESFELIKDPRSAATQEDLQEQFDFLIAIRDRVSEANRAVEQIRDIQSQIDGALQRAKGEPYHEDLVAQAEPIKEKLGATEKAIYQTKNRSRQDPLNFPIRLNNKIAALTGVVASTDAKPTDASRAVFEELSAKLQVELDRLAAVINEDIQAFNARVAEYAVPAVIVRDAEDEQKAATSEEDSGG